MADRPKFGGRKKGTPNKTTANVKAALEEAFEKMGGVDALVTWAQSEPTEFYKLYAKLLPIHVQADVSVDMSLADRLMRAAERIKGKGE